MELTVSKSVREGMPVMIRGNKVIRYTGKQGRMVGIWSRGFSRTTIMLDGVWVSTEAPCGIVVSGEVNVVATNG